MRFTAVVKPQYDNSTTSTNINSNPTDSLNAVIHKLCADFRPAFDHAASTYKWFYVNHKKETGALVPGALNFTITIDGVRVAYRVEDVRAIVSRMPVEYAALAGRV